MSGARASAGLSTWEQKIMDLHDQDFTAVEIAAELNVKVKSVRGCISAYGFESLGRTLDASDAAIRASTKALERAILATGKRHS